MHRAPTRRINNSIGGQDERLHKRTQGTHKKVEATRPKRVERAKKGERFPSLTMDQRKEWLKQYHPDYKSDGRRAVLAGPNKGDVFPEEVAVLLESKASLTPRV